MQVESNHFSGYACFYICDMIYAVLVHIKTHKRVIGDSHVYLYLSLFLSFLSGEGDEEGGEPQQPSCCDYFMHAATVFWKILFAFVPPTEYFNGWACFIVCILVIGMLTAVIGDLASHFGCTVGLRDTVTAVVFVALGTSIPGKSVS